MVRKSGKIYYAYIRKQAMEEGWSDKYKKSIDCDNPKGFSQKAHCQGKKKMNEETCPICGCDCQKRDGKSSKDKGYSLRDWFKGGGWKQTGGKYDGKPCAKQPGQKTKPYCRDADDRAAMSKEERNKRARKKRKEDPNPNRKGKAKNVTQESYSNWRQDLHEIPVIPLALGAAAIGGGLLAGKKASQFIDKQRTTMPNDYKIKRQQGGLGAGLARMRTGGLSPQQLRQLNQSYKPEGEIVEPKGNRDDGDMIRPGDIRGGYMVLLKVVLLEQKVQLEALKT